MNKKLMLNFADFAEWLKTTRNEQGLSLRQLVNRSGNVCTDAYLSRIENRRYKSKKGEPMRPDKEIVKALAVALNADIDEVLNLAGFASDRKPTNLATIAGEEFEILVYEADKLPEHEKAMAFDLAKDILRRFIEKEKNKKE